MLTTIDACRVVSGTCRPAPEVRGRSIGMPPRLVLEALLPWRALGMVTAPHPLPHSRAFPSDQGSSVISSQSFGVAIPIRGDLPRTGTI